MHLIKIEINYILGIHIKDINYIYNKYLIVKMDNAALNQNIFNLIMNSIKNKEIDYTDGVILKNKINISISELTKFINENVKTVTLRLKYNHLINNNSHFERNCIPYKDARKIKRDAWYLTVCKHRATITQFFVYSIFYYVNCRLHQNLHAKKYTTLAWGSELKIYSHSMIKLIDKLQLLIRKIKFKNNVKKFILYFYSYEDIDNYCTLLKQFINIIARNFCNIEQLTIINICGFRDVQQRRCASYEKTDIDSDYYAMQYIIKVCAAYLLKLKSLYYCTKYYNPSGAVTYKFFDRYNFKVQYENTQDNTKIQQFAFGCATYHL